MAKIRKGCIQNEETLLDALEGKTLFIPCLSEKDAHSKSVSLHNARNSRLSPSRQAKIRIQKMQLDGEWGVKVFPASETIIWEIKDGEKVRWNPNAEVEAKEGVMSSDDNRVLSCMRKDGKSLEEIIEILGQDKKEEIEKRIAAYGQI